MTPDLLALAVRAARARCRLEIQAVGAILPRPAELLRVAADAGLAADSFAFPDLRHVFLSAADDVRLGLDPDLLPHRLIHSFRQSGHWRADHRGRGIDDMLDSMHWSYRTVFDLFRLNFYSPPNVRRAVAELAAHVRACRESDEHAAHALRLLGGHVPAVGACAAGLHLVKLARLYEIPVETLADELLENSQTRRVA